MEEKSVYIMSCQRGQASPELHYMCDNYADAITVYYNHYVKDKRKNFLEMPERAYWYMYLFKFPMGINFSTVGFSGSDVKLQKSSKYRIKFKTYGDLINEYKVIQRDKVIDDVLTSITQ